MKHCPPTPSPSTTDLKTSTPETLVPGPDPASGYETVAKLRIKMKAWFGRLHIEHVMYKRRQH